MLASFIILQQSVEQIKEKIEQAPNSGYEIGIAIGTFLPLILLIAFAYFMFRKVKDKSDF